MHITLMNLIIGYYACISTLPSVIIFTPALLSLFATGLLAGDIKCGMSEKSAT